MGFEVCSFVTCQPSESLCSLASSNQPTATISISKSGGGVLVGAAGVALAQAQVWDVRRYRGFLSRTLLLGWLPISLTIPFSLLFWLCIFDNLKYTTLNTHTHTTPQLPLKDKKELEMKKKSKGKGGILRGRKPYFLFQKSKHFLQINTLSISIVVLMTLF